MSYPETAWFPPPATPQPPVLASAQPGDRESGPPPPDPPPDPDPD